MSSSNDATIKRRRFGRFDDEVSEIGFGCGGYWGFPVFSEKAAETLLRTALERGVNLLDTGPNYSGGNAEVRLGKFLRGRWDGIFVSTKVGTTLTDRGRIVKDWTVDGMRASLERSLKRLGTDRVDLLQLHSPTLEVIKDDRAMGFLASLREKGTIGYLGLSSSGDVARAAIESGHFHSVMVTYNVGHHRESGGIIRQAANAGMAVLGKSPLAHALYDPSFYRVRSLSQVWYILRALKTSRRGLARARRYRFLNEIEGWTATSAALRFVLDNQNITAAIVGTTKLPHLVANLDVSGRPPLPEEVVRRLEEVAGGVGGDASGGAG